MAQKLSQLVLGILILLLLTGLAAADPYLAIGGDQWQDALDGNHITSLDANDWYEIMQMWQEPNEGEPYPYSSFKPAQLYVYSPPGQIGMSTDSAVRFDINADGIVNFSDFAHFALEWLHPSYNYSSLGGKGLVMAWGDATQGPNEPWSSGWQFIYGEDPDLSNMTITVSVYPPDNIDAVSLGMEDIGGKRMAWQWGVPVPLAKGKYNLITINTANIAAGAAAAIPIATGFAVDGGFNITQVVKLFATENSAGSLGIQNVPPPNQNVKKPWNYWKDLVIAPNPLPPPPPPVPVYYKWRQPAQFVGNKSYYWGWDEVSIEANEPNERLLADDWCCMDNRPITDVHWWGSFPNRDPNKPGWRASNAPIAPIAPKGFHIGIWSDTQGDPNGQDLTIYSHPNEMLFSQYCYDYDVNFVGYDRDPNDPNHPVTDSCFKFSCDLDPNFTQDPNTHHIYWLSIAAVYDQNYPDPNYVWGWKTRPHYYNDDAVRIESIVGGGWPPQQGSQYESGAPLECPEHCSWDLAFELTTDQNDTDSCNCFRR